MKLNRFVALAAIALLVVGAMGAVSALAFVKGRAVAPAVQAPCRPDTEEVGQADAGGPEAADADEAGCGDETPGAPENPDGQNEQAGQEADDAPEVAPAGTPAISAEAARQTAESYLNSGAATSVELDDENGQLVYSVDIGGTDVVVDAMTGQVLRSEPAED